MKKFLITFCIFVFANCVFSQIVLFEKNKNVNIYVSSVEKQVVQTAVEILQQDVRSVFEGTLIVASNINNAKIIVGTLNHSTELQKFIKKNNIDITEIQGKWEAFQIQCIKNYLVIIGSDPRGTAYGLLELSRLFGVSPWEWWADATSNKQEKFSLSNNYKNIQTPAVQYRGIFLNDEDWGLTPWSTHTFEPEAKTKFPVTGRFKGQIGPKTYAKIFELMLRLRANTIWPAMHEVTMPFYFVEGNRETADKYGIIVGASHCEPMMRNSATEWDLTENVAYNLFTNKVNIISYWEDRLKELKNAENIFTIGMRGKHDSRMEGAKTIEDYKAGLEQAIEIQTELLKTYINTDVSKIPQQFVPYNEVLDVYNSGLKVPDYITLMWPDDNHGYIRHFPDANERQRSGGTGVYYHISYWGRPHDYLWLSTMNPALIYQQMTLAYERGVQKLWIVNVGDIKPCEYQTELFLDLAWNINLDGMQVSEHLANWLKREFGEEYGAKLLPIMNLHYHLANIRRPEFLGNTRVYQGEERTIISDLEWSETDIRKRLSDYEILSDKVEAIAAQIPDNKLYEYIQLVKYPVQAAAQMNFKLLYAQLARHGKAAWKQSDTAFDSIASLTKIYNSHNNGKWNRMMDFQPRKLPVFERVPHDVIHTPLPISDNRIVLQPENNSNIKVIEGLGVSGKSFLLPKNNVVNYSVKNCELNDADSLIIEVRLVPTHVVEGNNLRFSISFDGSKPQTNDYETKILSEEWYQNVIRNYAVRKFTFPIGNDSLLKDISITALDEGVYIDEVLIKKTTILN